MHNISAGQGASPGRRALAAVVALGIAAAATFGCGPLPRSSQVERSPFANARSDLRLDFPAAQQDRRQLPDGTEYFGARGTITNVGEEMQSVPPLLIVFRDDLDRVVSIHEAGPSTLSLAPGQSLIVSEVVTDVPRSARVVEIGWKPDIVTVAPGE